MSAEVRMAKEELYSERVSASGWVILLLSAPSLALLAALIYAVVELGAGTAVLPGLFFVFLLGACTAYLLSFYGTAIVRVERGALTIVFARAILRIYAKDVESVSLGTVGALSVGLGPRVSRSALKFVIGRGPTVIFKLRGPVRTALGPFSEVWVSTRRPSALLAALKEAGFPTPVGEQPTW